MVLGITGATGQLGGRVARLVAAAGVEQRLVVRTPAKAPTLPGTTVAQASYADRDAVRRALDGLDTVLMVAGDGRFSAVGQDDIAAAASAVLLDPGAHPGRTYSLTGPEAFTLTEAAATMSRVLGRDYAFQDESLEEAHASRASYGAPGWQVDAWVSSYTAIAAGEMSGVTGDVELLTGRPATSLADVLAGRG